MFLIKNITQLQFTMIKLYNVITKKTTKIYRVSIKSLYNLKKLLKSEIMRYRNEVCFMLISIS